MASPTNVSLKGIIDWAEQSSTPGQDPPVNDINADKVDGKHYSEIISDARNGGAAGGDLSGTYPNPTVDGLQGRPVSNTSPDTGQVLTWDGAAWGPATVSGGAAIVPYGRVLASASGTWPVPTGVSKIRVTLSAGGGGGGNARCALGADAALVLVGGSGGGGGAHFQGEINVSAGEIVTYSAGSIGSPPSFKPRANFHYAYPSSNYVYNPTSSSEANGTSGASATISIGSSTVVSASGGYGGKGWIIDTDMDPRGWYTDWSTRLPGGAGGTVLVHVPSRILPGYVAINGGSGGSSGYVSGSGQTLSSAIVYPGLAGSSTTNASGGVFPPVKSYTAIASTYYGGNVTAKVAVGGSGGAGGRPEIVVPTEDGSAVYATVLAGHGGSSPGIVYGLFELGNPISYPNTAVSDYYYPGHNYYPGAGGAAGSGQIDIILGTSGGGDGNVAIDDPKAYSGSVFIMLEWGY